MRILQIITKSELGGAQSVLTTLVNSLVQNHEVIVVGGEGNGKMWEVISDKAIKINCPYLKRSISIINDIKATFFLHKIYHQYNPDIIHLHSSKAGILGRLASPKCKIVYTVHGFDSIRIAFRRMLPIEKIMQTRCQAIVGVSQYDVDNLRNEGITHGLSLIYNGVERPKAINKKDIVFSTEVNSYTKKILCIARLTQPKRPDIFMETASMLPNYAFIWIGNQFDVNEHPNNVFFMGNIPQASRYCQEIDAFMLASDYEGLPMFILEAMSYGKPIFASKVGGTSEIVMEGCNGYTLKNKADLFVEKIKYVLDDPKIYNDFSQHSLMLYNQKFTAQKMIGNYYNLYRTIYEKRPF